ncbi:hydroxyacylglutathione hydrolase [Methylocaldum szegediense]|uniref:Hydroxyacylglutathione hydrolase n=1 Tax=Methylocaldum szegediense TaxID=73780 RepID=A0ABM9I9H4_9GAMM|nr:hydroxyacylglutathione hydrolase [Methylocaldum szegediense]CAI8974401.1 Hydroxyacylglutathione hydrolase [Methylocaldum szegediense]
MLEVLQIPALKDNYIYLIHDDQSGETAAVDPAEAGPVLQALAANGWELTYVLNTHHHGDHVGGNLELKRRTGCRIVGSERDRERIPGIDIAVGEAATLKLGSFEGRVFDVPGHTRAHIAFWFAAADALFCGDTLFALGCGRPFEGTPEELWQSLEKLRALPPEAKVYCAHEYTESNGRFALTVEPENTALKARMAEVLALRQQNRPTVPSMLKDELATNPFLRPESEEIRRNLGMTNADPVDVFAELRRRKNAF